MKKLILNSFLLGTLVCGYTSCKHNNFSQPDALAMHIDSTQKASDNFFLYANGKWFKQNPIKASEQSNGIWQLIQDTINEQVKTICTSSATSADNEKGSNKQKIGDFYSSGMDSAAINKKGIADLKPELSAIDRVKTEQELILQTAKVQKLASSAFFGFYVAQDEKMSSKNALHICQSGLSLPDRSYYLDTDAKSKEIRAKFLRYATTIFQIIGYDGAKAQQTAQKLMKLETDLAKASRKKEDTRDPLSNYTKVTPDQLKSMTPAIKWEVFTHETGLSKIDSIIVGQPEFLTSLNGIMKTYSLESRKDYLKFHLVNGLTDYLDDKTFKAGFDFYDVVLRGVEQPKPRWKRVVEQTNGSLGELIGEVYVKEYLPEGTKEKLLEIGKAIKEVFAERIQKLDWMSPETKQKALKKLNAVIMKVGYPDKWKDMSKLQIDKNSYVRNVMNANVWGYDYMISQYGKPVDRTEWSMYPQTYNAYYNPSNNEIVIPGCNIIVPGYEGRMADDAILYAVIGGSTFGHELTHGFDDQGCKFDEKGNLQNWWTAEDSKRFGAKTKMIVKQFNDFVTVDNLHINGELTQGENIADLGGVMMGLEAFKKTEQYKKNEKIAGLTPTQRYFLGYALAWMVNMRPEGISTQVKTDEHSPAQWRVLGPLANLPEFYEAFGVKKGDKMWRANNERVQIW